LLDSNGEVALTLSLPTGTMDVLVTKKEGYTRNSKEPKDLSEALSMPDAQQWKDAVIKELTSLKDMGTYRIVSLPPGRKAVGCKLVLTRKFQSNGEIEKWKARCVLLGYRQREGVDYKETFAPTGGFSSFRIMCALANHYDWSIRQIDFQTAYLNSDMDYEMYIHEAASGNPMVRGHEGYARKSSNAYNEGAVWCQTGRQIVEQDARCIIEESRLRGNDTRPVHVCETDARRQTPNGAGVYR
jgi:hypothetical protein